MQAFLLAAGLGTRLKPMTETKPKALIEVQGKPLLQLNIENLESQGATRIVVNTHHFADQVAHFLASRRWKAEIVISDESNLLLDTGGGLKKSAPLFSDSEPIVIHNVDILSHIDLAELSETLLSSDDIATLAVSRRDTSRQLLFDPQHRLVGWKNAATGETLWATSPTEAATAFAFSGIAAIRPLLLHLLPPADHPYPIIPAYLQIAATHSIGQFLHPKEEWLDVGKPETLQQAQQWKLS